MAPSSKDEPEPFFDQLYDAAEYVGSLVFSPIVFGLRRWFQPRKSGYNEARYAPPAAEHVRRQLRSLRASELRLAYRLNRFDKVLDTNTRHVVLFYADILDQCREQLGDRGPEAARCLDIGSKSFDAALAIHQFALATGTEKPCLTGIEIDAYGSFRPPHTRIDAAEYYLAQLPDHGHRYIAADFLKHAGGYDLITWFYPFLTPYAQVMWGLPRFLLRPERMLTHMLGCLAPDGVALIVNQTEEEWLIQQHLLDAAGQNYETIDLQLNFRKDTPSGFATVLRAPTSDPADD